MTKRVVVLVQMVMSKRVVVFNRILRARAPVPVWPLSGRMRVNGEMRGREKEAGARVTRGSGEMKGRGK